MAIPNPIKHHFIYRTNSSSVHIIPEGSFIDSKYHVDENELLDSARHVAVRANQYPLKAKTIIRNGEEVQEFSMVYKQEQHKKRVIRDEGRAL